MASFFLNWLGNDLSKRADKAIHDGIDQTTAACVTVAQTLAPVDTGFMRNTMEFQEARREGKLIVGRWGNWTADYTIYVELGSRGRVGKYFLRRAADREYPLLAKRIKAAAKW